MNDTSALRIEQLELPVRDKSLVLHFWHKGSPWVEDIGSRLEGKCPGSRDRFLMAFDGPDVAAQAWYTVSETNPRLGLLGHVYTREAYRRQGLSTRLMEAAMAQFAREGGLSMQLFTYNPDTVPFYERCGFEVVQGSRMSHATDWYMRSPVGSKPLIDGWFAPRDTRIRPLVAADLPKYCLLYNLEYDTLLKDRAQGIGLGLETELTFITTLERTSRGGGVCLALDNGEAIVGIASLLRCDFPHQSHIGLVDCYVHPGFSADRRRLLEAVLGEKGRLGLEIVYALCVDDDKRRAFDRLGFRRCERLPRHYRVEGKYVDCDLYQSE